MAMGAQQAMQRAMAAHRAGDLSAAEAQYRAILRSAADHPVCLAQLAQLLTQRGRATEAVELLEPYLRRRPQRPLVRFRLGRALLELGRLDEATGELERAAEQRAEAEFYFWAGVARERQGHHERADAHFQRAIAAAAERPSAMAAIAERLHQLERHEQAARAFDRAADSSPGDAVLLLKASAAHLLAHRFDAARERCERARELAPDKLAVYIGLADLYDRMHDAERAAEAARAGLERFPEAAPLVRLLARLERRAGKRQTAERRIADARRRLAEEAVGMAGLLVEHAHALEAVGRYDEAWDAAVEGKRLWCEQGESPGADIERYPLRLAERLRQVERLDVTRWAKGPPAGAAPAPAFLVGFPRSGTTLTEQILAAHRGVVTSDEAPLLGRALGEARRMAPGEGEEVIDLDALSDEQILEVRRVYRAHAERLVASGGGGGGESGIGDRLFLDKLPLNIVDLAPIGRIWPEARVLVALRDPRDVCVSCLFQAFDLNDAMVQFTDPMRTAKLYEQVMGLYLIARERLAGQARFETRYEDLVRDVEGHARSLIEFLGLPWTDEVLAFQERLRGRTLSTPSYAAVTEKVSTRSVARWKRYEQKMQEMLPILEPFVREFGYEG